MVLSIKTADFFSQTQKDLPHKKVNAKKREVKISTRNWYQVNMNINLDVMIEFSGIEAQFEKEFTHFRMDGKAYRITGIEQIKQGVIRVEGQKA